MYRPSGTLLLGDQKQSIFDAESILRNDLAQDQTGCLNRHREDPLKIAGQRQCFPGAKKM
jgi:hypothetical protein